MMPTNFLLCCRLAESCAGGTLFGHMVGPPLSLSLVLAHALLHPLSKRFTCLARNSLPLRFFLSFSFFFPLFFTNASFALFGLFTGNIAGVADPVTLVTLARHRGTRYFLGLGR